jgi:hypothetical protein
MDLEPGYYWVQSINPEYPGIHIAEWHERGYWYDMGVEGHTSFGEYCVMSPRLTDPTGINTFIAADGTVRQSYYGDGKQPWDIIVEQGWGMYFAASNVLKYIRRKKDGAKDLEKARWYFNALREIVRGPHLRTDHYLDSLACMERLRHLLTDGEKADLLWLQ